MRRISPGLRPTKRQICKSQADANMPGGGAWLSDHYIYTQNKYRCVLVSVEQSRLAAEGNIAAYTMYMHKLLVTIYNLKYVQLLSLHKITCMHIFKGKAQRVLTGVECFIIQ